MGAVFSGNQEATVTYSDATSMVANVIQSTTQSCITSTVGGNSIIVDGNYNVLDNIKQSVEFTVDQNCGAMTQNNTQFAAAISNAVQQQANQASTNAGSFLSGDQTDTTNTNITNSVVNNVTQSVVQNCLQTNKFPNSITVIGDGNDVLNVTQSTVADIMLTCTLNSGSATAAAQTVADTANQSAAQTQANPLQPFADALQNMVDMGISAIAVVFVVLIVLVILYKALRHLRSSGAPGAPGAPSAPKAPSKS